jgi:hypothetical protein
MVGIIVFLTAKKPGRKHLAIFVSLAGHATVTHWALSHPTDTSDGHVAVLFALGTPLLYSNRNKNVIDWPRGQLITQYSIWT